MKVEGLRQEEETSGQRIDFGMVAQIRRAAVSVSSNIVESSKRLSSTDYARFINRAEGSLNEVESLLHLATRLGFVGG